MIRAENLHENPDRDKQAAKKVKIVKQNQVKHSAVYIETIAHLYVVNSG